MSPKKKKQQANIGPIVLIAFGAVLVLGVILWAALPKLTDQPQNTMADPNIPYPDIQRVSLEDSRTAFDQKTAVFVDVRSADSYAGGHIPGAVNIPLEDLPARANELDKNQWIITYCT